MPTPPKPEEVDRRRGLAIMVHSSWRPYIVSARGYFRIKELLGEKVDRAFVWVHARSGSVYLTLRSKAL